MPAVTLMLIFKQPILSDDSVFDAMVASRLGFSAMDYKCVCLGSPQGWDGFGNGW